MKPPQYQLVAGDAADLAIVGTGEADLIVTSPPYFSAATEELLRRPVAAQDDVERVTDEIVSFATSLGPVFKEMARVLKPGAALVLQTKDIRYAGSLIGLAAVHRALAETAGLSLVTRVFWRKTPSWPSRSAPFRRRPVVGALQEDDVGQFLVFAHHGRIRKR